MTGSWPRQGEGTVSALRVATVSPRSGGAPKILPVEPRVRSLSHRARPAAVRVYLPRRDGHVVGA